MSRLVLAAAVLAALLPASASAAPPDLADNQDRETTLVAYGEGVTHCTVRLDKSAELLWEEYPSWNFGGRTLCNVPVRQSGQAWLTSSGETLYAPLCSGLQAQCDSRSGGGGHGPFEATIRYQVRLTAPPGQGWVAAPSHCAGAGTDNLTCTFVLDLVQGL